MDSTKEKKEEQRKSVLAELKKLSTEVKVQESALLRKQLAEWISNNCARGSVIATFAGLDFEPDLIGLHELLSEYQLAYPRCGEERSLHFHRISDPKMQLQRGYYGIREPVDDPDTLIPVDQIALFIVPAFAYTEDGSRLGKGGGYYDRVLEGISTETIILGVSFSIQLKKSLPTENHDIPVHHVVIPM